MKIHIVSYFLVFNYTKFSQGFKDLPSISLELAKNAEINKYKSFLKSYSKDLYNIEDTLQRFPHQKFNFDLDPVNLEVSQSKPRQVNSESVLYSFELISNIILSLRVCPTSKAVYFNLSKLTIKFLIRL